jgi:DNA-binding GntR family transcriptional regulator
MQAISRQSLTDLVAEAIFQRLVAGELKPGDKLTENQLADELQVSRTPIREALQRLTTLGLLEKDTHRGAQVAQPSLAELLQVYEVREALEGRAAGLFALRATPQQRAELRQTWLALEAARRAQDALGVRVLDFNLHRQLIQGSNNEYLAGAGHAEALMLVAYLVRRSGEAPPPAPANGPPQDPHAEVMAAIFDHDPDAAEAAMRAHVRGTRLGMLPELEASEKARLYPEPKPNCEVHVMSQTPLSGKERLLAAVRHQEPDRVPICPRIQWAWLDPDKRHRLEELYAPAIDPMEIFGSTTPIYAMQYPEEYSLPEVKVEQTRYQEGNYQVVERTFHTPAGKLSDRTKIPPSGREYGMAPNPIKTEFLVKGKDDIPALRYILPEIKGNYDAAAARQRELGDRGVVMVNVYSELCHQAGDVRDMQDLMMDYYLDRPFFDELVGLFQERTLAEAKAVMEAGVEWVFMNSYYNSVSAGWSPAIFGEVFVPHIKQVVDLVHNSGGYVDYYDDGHLARTMGLLADCNVDVLETCTPPPMCDFDLREAKATIGEKVTLKGYVDLLYVVMRGTPELVERTVAEAMEIAKPGGGFIIGSSDSFREGTPPENMHAYFQACLKYGVYV